jgi:group I intron endonuclease
MRGVYTIELIGTGRCYVGSTKNTTKRWRDHIKSLRLGTHHCSHLQRAWLKYGEKAFRFDLVEEVPLGICLLEREQEWMDKTLEKFNTCPKAGSPLGMKLTTEQCEKISRALSGKPKSDAHRAACSEGQRIRAKRPEEQERIEAFAKNRLGKKASEEHSRNMSIALKEAFKARPYDGGKNPAARPCRLGKKRFSCIKEACEKTGLSKYKLKLHPDFSYIK